MFIDIKGVLFFPLHLQYLPDMLLVLVLDDSHISGSGPKIAPSNLSLYYHSTSIGALVP